MVGADPHGAAEIFAKMDKRHKLLADALELGLVLAVGIFADFEFLFIDVVAGIDTDFLHPFRRLHGCVRFEMDIGNERHMTARGANFAGDVFEVCGVDFCLGGDAHDFASGIGQGQDLGDAGRGVAGVGSDHRLHPYRVVSPNAHISDPDLAGDSSREIQQIGAVLECGVVAHEWINLNWKISVGNAEIRCIFNLVKIKISWARKVAAVAAMLAASNQQSWGGDFVRVRETDTFAKLQTAVLYYEKDGKRVELIGAIHLADRRYYEFLNKYFKNHEALLFEMVGGEKLAGGGEPDPEDEDAAEDLDALGGLNEIYATVEKALGLVGQGAVIDYTAKNFVHADLTMKEFEALQKERGESLLGFMIEMGIKGERPKHEPNSLRLMRGMLSGRSDLVKLEMMQTMAEGDEQIDTLAGESVIISDRNARCMEVMDKELAAGRNKIGIFYGVAHFPDMHKRMEERGFKKVDTKWLTAWQVKK